MIHKLKILREHFDGQCEGSKTFEIRKDDREPRFEAGDDLHMFLWSPEEGYHGEAIVRRVLHVLRDCDGLEPGYCIMATTYRWTP